MGGNRLIKSAYIRVVEKGFFVERIDVTVVDFCSCYEFGFCELADATPNIVLCYAESYGYFSDCGTGIFEKTNKNSSWCGEKIQSVFWCVLNDAAF